MQEVADWLEKLGLGQYAERFAENGISIAALPHLFDQDLKDIGVLLGHRRIMLAALGELVPGATTAERSAAVVPLPRDFRPCGPTRCSSFSMISSGVMLSGTALANSAMLMRKK